MEIHGHIMTTQTWQLFVGLSQLNIVRDAVNSQKIGGVVNPLMMNGQLLHI